MLITAPQEYKENPFSSAKRKRKVFLAGTIENGKSADWQALMSDLVISEHHVLFNPRRADWNSEASAHDINMQILWEQRHIDMSDIVFFNILPESQSMITLLELGQMCERTKDKQVIVCCPKEYTRFDNVFTMCAINGIPLFTDFELAVNYLNIRLNLK